MFLGHFLDVGVARKVFYQDEDFDPREVELCFELRHPNIVRLLGASAAVSDLPPSLYFELVDGPSLRQVFFVFVKDARASRAEDPNLTRDCLWDGLLAQSEPDHCSP